MYISEDDENLKNAEYSENKFRNLSEEERKVYINNVYNYYNNTLPLVEHNIEDIRICYKNLESDQKYYLYEKVNDFSLLKKYNFNNLINFINKTEIKNFSFNKNNFIKKFGNINLIIYDYDYKINYINICTLSDFYNNEERMKCQVLNYKVPITYYQQNYYKILLKYFENLKKYYEYGLKINKLNFTNIHNKNIDYKNSINSVYLQNIMYENNKYCTVYKPYLFKLFINLFGATNIIDLSSGWGDRLLAAVSQQNNINLYVGIDPNTSLFKGYNKIIKDHCDLKNKDKYVLLNLPAEEVDYIKYDNIDMIFWSPPFFNIETYTHDNNQSIMTYNKYSLWEDYFLIYVINLATNSLRLNGVLILYLGGINYKSFFQKMNNIPKLKYLGDINIYSDKLKGYMIFVKIKENSKIKYIDNKIENIKIQDNIKEIKNKIKKQEENPKLDVIFLNINNIKNNKENNKIILIQEGTLIAGTKQRASTKMIQYILDKNKNIKTLVYAGSYNGYGAVATAYAANKLGLQCKVFLSEMKNGELTNSSYDDIIKSKQINTLLALDSKIYLCPNYKIARELKYDYATISTTEKEKWLTREDYYIAPMGLNDDDGIMIDILYKQIIEAIKKTNELDFININSYTGTIWCVAGTGGIVKALHKVFNNASFCIYLTGGGKYYKNIYEWANNNNIIILNDNKEYEITNIKNDYKDYYKSVDNYDSLIWPWVKKYGKTNDILWNVAQD